MAKKGNKEVIAKSKGEVVAKETPVKTVFSFAVFARKVPSITLTLGGKKEVFAKGEEITVDMAKLDKLPKSICNTLSTVFPLALAKGEKLAISDGYNGLQIGVKANKGVFQVGFQDNTLFTQQNNYFGFADIPLGADAKLTRSWHGAKYPITKERLEKVQAFLVKAYK